MTGNSSVGRASVLGIEGRGIIALLPDFIDEKFENHRWWALVKCSVCDTEIWRRKTHIFPNVYCSRNCQSVGKSESITLECGYCQKKVKRRKSQIDKSKTGKVFCNRSCATSFNNKFKVEEFHPNWKGGTNYREKAFSKFGEICCNPDCSLQKSGIEIPKKMLDVDHIDSNRSNNKIENLMPLCVWCHALKTRKDW